MTDKLDARGVHHYHRTKPLNIRIEEGSSNLYKGDTLICRASSVELLDMFEQVAEYERDVAAALRDQHERKRRSHSSHSSNVKYDAWTEYLNSRFTEEEQEQEQWCSADLLQVYADFKAQYEG